jgi:2-polyprenyl-6-methoxyphenol hydroxylase-like FAD-dependent oxidoreductase
VTGSVEIIQNIMEQTSVVVVGAGPTGLALAITLGLAGTSTIVLEKEATVTEDPRGITLTGDAVRIAFQLGLKDVLLTTIGLPAGVLHFHHLSYHNPSFMTMDVSVDWMEQAVSNAITQFQPELETQLRSALKKIPGIVLRSGCEVVDRVEDGDGVTVTYCDRNRAHHTIRANWLVGADGKKGVVRKKFLEPHGIKQVTGLYEYEGMWMAANLKITIPTPETHPSLPIWKLGCTPEELCEIFWPTGFHFCNDPDRPAVSGKFGPPGTFFWRHEYAIKPGDSVDEPEADFWLRFAPFTMRPGSCFGPSITEPVHFPRNCIEVIRCRPFRFAAKVANKWYHGRTIVIGDAAHVFPPFGGQGIAAGFRDASSLGWRLALMEHSSSGTDARERLLAGWNNEQRQRVDESLRVTSINGSLVNQASSLMAFLSRTAARALWYIPGVAGKVTQAAMGDHTRLSACEYGCFITHRDGGRKLAQIWVQAHGGKPQLSDEVFFRQRSKFALLVLCKTGCEIGINQIEEVVENMGLPSEFIGIDSVTVLADDPGRIASNSPSNTDFVICHPCSAAEVEASGKQVVEGYDQGCLRRRCGTNAYFVLVRPDFIIHSIASNPEQLKQNTSRLLKLFHDA